MPVTHLLCRELSTGTSLPSNINAAENRPAVSCQFEPFDFKFQLVRSLASPWPFASSSSIYSALSAATNSPHDTNSNKTHDQHLLLCCGSTQPLHPLLWLASMPVAVHITEPSWPPSSCQQSNSSSTSSWNCSWQQGTRQHVASLLSLASATGG